MISIMNPSLSCNWQSSRKGNNIKIITIHCWAGNGEGLPIIDSIIRGWNNNSSAMPSSNYLIDNSGQIYYGVPEGNKANTTSSSENDLQSVTIEVSQTKKPSNESWSNVGFSKEAISSLIGLCADIIRRNGMGEMRWLNDSSLKHKNPDKQNVTVHRWYANKSCPGDWMYARMGKLADAVNKELGKQTNYSRYDGNNATLYDNIVVPMIAGGSTGGGSSESNKYESSEGSRGQENKVRPIMASRGDNKVYNLATSSTSNKNALSVEEKRREKFNELAERFSKSAPELGRDIVLSKEMFGAEILKGSQNAKTFRDNKSENV